MDDNGIDFEPLLEAIDAEEQRRGFKKYSVNTWGSAPSEGNDDCTTGDEFATLEEARRVYESPEGHFPLDSRSRWIQLVGPGVREEKRDRPDSDFPPDDDSDWRTEWANQQGMAFGAQAYNEALDAIDASFPD